MNIVTVTLNPAIDQTVTANEFSPNTVNRAEAMQFDPGGKGVNVASFLADYGLGVTATGFLGEQNASLFEQLFAQKQIADRFIRVPGRTRTNIKIMDSVRQQTTDINMAGQTPTPQALSQLEQTLSELAETSSWFVLSGNLPPGVPADIYARLVTMLKARGRFVALDTSREALALGLTAAPTIAKPNIDELRQMTGLPLRSLAEVREAAAYLLSAGIQLVVVSMGAEGALFVSVEDVLLATPPKVQVKTTVGAGDAMVAGLVASRSLNLSPKECARLATAFSLGAITHIGAHLPPRPALDAYLEQVSVVSVSG